MIRALFVFAAFFLLANLASANVIFPAFAAPYFVQAFSPVMIIAVMLLECSVAYYRERQLGAMGSVATVAVANASSWVVGVALAFWVFPSGLGQPEDPDVARNFNRLVLLSLPAAYFVSILVEAAVYGLLSKQIEIRAPYLLSAIANTGSYVVIALAFWSYGGAF